MTQEKPILFSGPMIRALLEGRKTQTRRIVASQLPPEPTKISGKRWGLVNNEFYYCGIKSPYGFLGDHLWVRESCWLRPERTPRMLREGADTWPKVTFHADLNEDKEWYKEMNWKSLPSIYMPRWASRVTLEIIGIRVERIQDISEEDARAEGAEFHDGRGIGHSGWRHDRNHGYVYDSAKRSFNVLWDSINAKRGFGWDKNPWVWVISFKVIKP